MANKTIVITLPTRLSDYVIVKNIRLDDDPSIQIEISDNISCAEISSDDCIFFCNQQKQKIAAQFKFSVASSRGANQRWCIHDTGRTGCPQCHAAVL